MPQKNPALAGFVCVRKLLAHHVYPSKDWSKVKVIAAPHTFHVIESIARIVNNSNF